MSFIEKKKKKLETLCTNVYSKCEDHSQSYKDRTV